MRLPSRTLGLLVLLGLGPAGPSAAAAAPECPAPPEPGVDSVLPADGAQGVTTDAWVRVRYTEGYFVAGQPPTESVVLRDPMGNVVPGSVQVVGDRDLFFTPTSPFLSNTKYTGSTSGSVPFTFAFTTGPTTDLQAPRLADPPGDPEFRVTSTPVDASCDAPEGGRRIGVTFTSAADDGPTASLEYSLYVSRGTGIEAPVLVDSGRSYGATTTMAFVLPPQQLEGQVCIDLTVADGVGKTDRWSSPYCFDPVTGTAFYGMCSLSPGASAPASGWLLVLPLAWLGLRRSRRREGFD
ncbi:MAG: Ig-like domain-containing protein [Polyangiales bacterium]